jgi:hypothetical protein
VVTSLDPVKEDRLRIALGDEGARSVQFLGVSRSKAMLDTIDLSHIQLPIDVALVGAGVGAANILQQLMPLRTLCIDAGYVLDCIAQPERKGTRVFTLPDSELAATL